MKPTKRLTLKKALNALGFEACSKPFLSYPFGVGRLVLWGRPVESAQQSSPYEQS